MEKYELQKTIRFKLDKVQFPDGNFNENASEEVTTLPIEKLQQERLKSIENVIDAAQNVSSTFKELVLQKNEEKNTGRINAKLKIHYRWLRQYCGYDFYEEKNERTRGSKKQNITASKILRFYPTV